MRKDFENRFELVVNFNVEQLTSSNSLNFLSEELQKFNIDYYYK